MCVCLCRWLTDFRRSYAAAPDADRAPHRAAEDHLHSEGSPALLPPGKDFRPSPLGRSVITALEAQLDKVGRGFGLPPYINAGLVQDDSSRCIEITLCTEGPSASGPGMMPAMVCLPSPHHTNT